MKCFGLATAIDSSNHNDMIIINFWLKARPHWLSLVFLKKFEIPSIRRGVFKNDIEDEIAEKISKLKLYFVAVQETSPKIFFSKILSCRQFHVWPQPSTAQKMAPIYLL